MRKEPLLPPLTGGEGLGAELGRGKMLGRGEGEMVVVGRGKKGGCNSRIEESNRVRKLSRLCTATWHTYRTCPCCDQGCKCMDLDQPR